MLPCNQMLLSFEGRDQNEKPEEKLEDNKSMKTNILSLSLPHFLRRTRSGRYKLGEQYECK